MGMWTSSSCPGVLGSSWKEEKPRKTNKVNKKQNYNASSFLVYTKMHNFVYTCPNQVKQRPLESSKQGLSYGKQSSK
jgi:hypothetical protein